MKRLHYFNTRFLFSSIDLTFVEEMCDRLKNQEIKYQVKQCLFAEYADYRHGLGFYLYTPLDYLDNLVMIYEVRVLTEDYDKALRAIT